MRERNPKRKSICECAQSAKGSFQTGLSTKKNVVFLSNNIGFKHVFLCINICWTPRMMLTIPEGFGRCKCIRKPCSIVIIA